MKVKELFTGPDKWTRRVFARDSKGAECNSSAKSATCFCMMGAVLHCYPDVPKAVWDDIKRRVTDATGADSVYQWNDDPARTFDEVKALVEKLDI